MQRTTFTNLGKLWIASLMLCFLGFFACQESTEEDPVPADEIEKVTENPNPPENNEAIVSEKTFGDTSQFNQIFKMLTQNNDIYFLSDEGGISFFGKMDVFGQVDWKRQLSFTPNDLFHDSNGNIVLVGFTNDNGNISVYDETGSEKKSLIIAETGYAKVLLRSITLKYFDVSREGKITLGLQTVGVVQNSSGTLYPYGVLIRYETEDNLFTKEASKVFNDYPNRRFNEIKKFTPPQTNTGEQSSFLISGNVGSSLDERERAFYK